MALNAGNRLGGHTALDPKLFYLREIWLLSPEIRNAGNQKQSCHP
jgi:hypothetical protein